MEAEQISDVKLTKANKLFVKFVTHKKISIYDKIKELGFGYISFLGKKKYILRENNKIRFCYFSDIKDAYINYLKGVEVTYNKQVLGIRFINSFYQKNPLKPNHVLHQVISTDINDEELHLLRLEKDNHYKTECDNVDLLRFLNEQQFKKVMDKTESGYIDLYYKKIDNFNYLVFSSWLNIHVNNYYFDCDIMDFNNEKNIGIQRPKAVVNICSSFRLENVDIIEQYLN